MWKQAGQWRHSRGVPWSPMDDFRSDVLLWAVHLGADEFEARWALSWLDDPSLPSETHDALEASLAAFSPAWAGQVIADIGGGEFRLLLSQRADRLVREQREARLYALQTMPYREYLRTPEWRSRAEATYARFGGAVPSVMTWASSRPITGRMNGGARRLLVTSQRCALPATRSSTSGETSLRLRSRPVPSGELTPPGGGAHTRPSVRQRRELVPASWPVRPSHVVTRRRCRLPWR